MTVSKYLLEKVARHGVAAQRLIDEREAKRGELSTLSEISSVAFDAADFVWTYLSLTDDESVQESRQLRNRVAEAIIKALQQTLPSENLDDGLGYVFENDGSPLGPNQVDGFRDTSSEDDEAEANQTIEMSVRDTGSRTMLVLRMSEQMRGLFSKYAYSGTDDGGPWTVPVTLELSQQAEWITDSSLRTKAKRRKETVHLRIPLNEIHLRYTKE